MKGTPPEKENKIQSDESNDSVQDYLDLLLSSATEKPEAQVHVSDDIGSINKSTMKEQTGQLNTLPSEKIKRSDVENKGFNDSSFRSTGANTLDENLSDAPENNAPENNAPENNAPENNAPKNNAPGNNARADAAGGNNNTPARKENYKLKQTVANTTTTGGDQTAVQAFQSRRRRKTDPARSDNESSLQLYKEPETVSFKIPLPKLNLEPDLLIQDSTSVDSAKPVTSKKSVIESSQTNIEKSDRLVEISSEHDEAQNNSLQLTPQRPHWAHSRFECLLFTVGGLTLAVPLSELGAIYLKTGELTPIFGQVDWFLGLMPVQEHNIRVINTAKVVMPERYTDTMIDGFGYVISLNGVDWGLAVDAVSKSISLEPDNIRWSSKKGKRPWLAGTVIEHMCALLDVSQLAKMFTEQENRAT